MDANGIIGREYEQKLILERCKSNKAELFLRMFIPGLAVRLWMLPVQNGEEVRLTC